MVKMTSKVQPATNDWTVDRENKERNGETPLRRRKYFEWIIKQIIEFGFRRIWIILHWDLGGCYHLGLRPLWITPSLIGRILHILRKPNSIIALLFIQNISSCLKEFRHYALCFPLTKYNTTLSPGFLGQRFNNLQRAALLTSFWRHRFNNFRRAALLTSFIQYGEDSLQIWWTAAGCGELCVWF